MENQLTDLNLFLEGVACDLCRFRHMSEGLSPEDIRIQQEVKLAPGAFADILVQAGHAPAYFVEIDVGYSAERIVESVRRKYSGNARLPGNASHVTLVIDEAVLARRPDLPASIRAELKPGLELTLWTDRDLLHRLGEQFDVTSRIFDETMLLDLRQAIDTAKGKYAFGSAFANTPLESALLWAFAFWRLRQLRDAGREAPRSILPPGTYADIVVVFADLCSYSSYVRDTRDEAVIRQSLTSFSSKTRYRIINDGGMLYQFLGDSVIGLFGLPERSAGYVEEALACARRLVDIGASVAEAWQRHIDSVQAAAGVHVSMAIGSLQMLSLRPLSRTYMGAVADSINLAARLNAAAGPGEIVVSNALYGRLAYPARAGFQELEPIDARNIGRIRAWKLAPAHAAPV